MKHLEQLVRLTNNHICTQCSSDIPRSPHMANIISDFAVFPHFVLWQTFYRDCCFKQTHQQTSVRSISTLQLNVSFRKIYVSSEFTENFRKIISKRTLNSCFMMRLLVLYALACFSNDTDEYNIFNQCHIAKLCWVFSV